MILKNGTVFYNGKFEKKDIEITDDIFSSIQNEIASSDRMDYTDKLIVPGLIDIHTHGCVGYDFTTASVSEIEKMCEFYVSKGITSVLATTMTYDYQAYTNTFTNIKEAMHVGLTGSRIIGINMEGPFLGEEKKGAHDPKYLLPLNEEKFDELNALSGNNITIIDLDPKLDGALDFIEKYSKDKVISLAHTTCDYDLAAKAIKAGASHITHLFNGMNGLHHRQPNLIGAFSDYNVYAELICDGIHIHPSVIRMMFKIASDRIILISDSISAAGLPKGYYELGGQTVYVDGIKSTLNDGTLAGSTITVYDALKRAIQFGVPKEQAILSATLFPAKAIKADKEIGSISVGKKADFIITDKDLNIEAVYKDGILI
jgi:N-acetylglucosamine-6-phosphate deacetylase